MINESDLIKFDNYILLGAISPEMKEIWINLKTELLKINLEDDLFFKTEFNLLSQFIGIGDSRPLERSTYFENELIKRCIDKKEGKSE